MRSRRHIFAILFLLCGSWGAAQSAPSSKVEVEKRVDALIEKMTLEEKITILGGINSFYTQPILRLGIPSLKMSDGPLGVHDYGPTTAYPAGISLAASWDTELAGRVGTMMGRDARARGVHFILAPGMNIYRAPMNGRNFEYFGEDPFLAARVAVSLIKGVQSQRVIATAKHFAGNNSEYGRMDVSSDIDERTLREIYLPAFEASVRDARVGAVMDAYNPVNGVYMTQNQHLNNEILKKDWGFDGILMSDWGATHDGIAAAQGGLDLEMPNAVFMNRDTLLPAIKDGNIPIASIDDKVRRILRKAIEFGFFDQTQTDIGIPQLDQEGRQVVLQEAREGMVLLKNAGGVLPLDKSKLKTIAVIGPNAYPAVIGGGGSSLTKPFNAVSFLEGISNYLGTGVKVLYAADVPDVAQVFASSETLTAPDGTAGLKGEYFNNESLEGTPALVRVDPRVDFQWGDASYAATGPTDHFSVRWTGNFIPKKSGDYSFYTNSDDGVRLYLDEQAVINDWQRHAETVNSYAAHLEAGQAYKIRLEYFEAVGGATIGFAVSPTEQWIGSATKALAKNADAVILCVGFDPNTESEGSDRTFRLPAGQEALIHQISEVNKNTIVVLTAGGNVDMNDWIDRVASLLHAWYPGQEGGTALAQILFGEYSPSGKLPASFERRWEDNPTYLSYYPQKKEEKRVGYSEGVFVGYRHFDRATVKPRFAFGHGLSYTTFAYKNLSISPPSGDLSGPITVSFDVTNTGKREGAEVAELYIGDGHASVPRPVKELKGFARVNLKVGETRPVSIRLDRRAFAFYDIKSNNWRAEAGEFSLLVGSASDDIRLQGTFKLEKAVDISYSH